MCCPDNASAPISPISMTLPENQSTQKVPTETNNISNNLTAVKIHRNINLINVKCGSSSNDRIINGKVTAPNEFPWM